MKPAGLLSGQLRHPRGWIGALLGPVMNRSNAGLNRLALEQSRIEPGNQVLEIGFGGGALLEMLLASAMPGIAAGVELSRVLLRNGQMRRGLRGAVLREGAIESLPFSDGVFDRVATVNTIYFWSDPARGLREVERVLKPGGRFTIGFHTEADLRRTGVSKAVFRPIDGFSVETLLADHGFVSISSAVGRAADREFICVSGHRERTTP
jgi:arsenite methyltransferase